jgi:two-component system phosphate regulon response regulator PhoB
MAERILVVDDEPDLLELVRVNLARSGYDVVTAETGSQALAELHKQKPDLVLLDIMLPDHSGTEICREIRADPELADLPVIMLTALSEEVDRVVGFELGADDYVSKPFSPRELVLRVKAVLRRRTPSEATSSVLRHGPFSLDLERRSCRVEDEEVELTAKEFSVLESLMTRPGRVFTRERLLDTIWGSDVAVTLRTIDTHVKRLREKMGEAGELIDTVRGVGYRLRE